MTVREVARAVGIPASTAGDYFAGRHLPPPSQPGLLTRILRVCGETDPVELREWVSALNLIRRGPGRRPAAATAPYRGLASFQPEDAAWFFGREAITGRLVRLATEAFAPGVPLTLVGPSGSGKSSLLRAGLIPSLPDWSQRRLALFTPGATPLGELARQLARLHGAAIEEAVPEGDADDPASTDRASTDPASTVPPGTDAASIDSPAADPASAGPAGSGDHEETSRIEAALRRDPGDAPRLIPDAGGPEPVIVVDQFEEVFTACRDEVEQHRFITAICALAGPAVVVLALRADFYDRALRYPELAGALQERQVVLVPMTRREVRSAIVEPARLARLEVADGLVELLLSDLAPRSPDGSPAGAGHEAGALPLLSHALLTTWSRSHGGRLTVADYQASGGIRHAIARTADQVYGSLDEQQRDIARRLFLRLVNVADDAPETRSSVRLDELRDWPDEAASPGEVLDRFVAERLITVDADTAQITHEALLTAWPLLHTWIDGNREGLRVRRRLSDAARAWDETGRDPAALLRGGQLALARDWAADPLNRDSLGTLPRAFVDAGIVQERLQQAAERNRTLRLRRLVAALSVLVVLTVGLAGYAFQQRQAATSARDNATTARNTAQSREVAIEADQIRGQSAALAAQLSVAAYRITPTAEARASLLESTGSPAAARLLDSADVVEAVSLSPDHHVLAVAAADGTLRLWDVARPGHPVPLGATLQPRNRNDPLYSVAFSPAGSLLAAAGAGREVLLWNVRNPAHPVRLPVALTGPANTVYSLAFSARRPLLAAGSADDTVRLWNLADPDRPAAVGKPLTGPAGFVQSVAFSPDGRTLAAGSTDRTVHLWDVSNPAHPVPLGKPLTGPGKGVYSVAFSPDGRTLAAGSQDNKVWLWKVATPARPRRDGTLTGATDWVNTVAFSPDGRSLAAGSSDDRVLVWNLATRTLTATMPQPQPVTSLAWDGAGHLVAGDADGMVRNWILPTPVLAAGSPVNSVAYSPGSRLLAVGGNSGLQVWNPATRRQLAGAPGPAGAIVNAVAFSPAGTSLTAGYGDGDIQLWRVAPGGALTRLSRPLLASATGAVEFAAFSPDGRLLATCGDDGTMRLWSVTDPARPRRLATVPDSPGTIAYSVAFSPDGKTLAAASADGFTRLWNISDPARPALLGRRLAGPASYAISVAFSPDGRILAVGSADHRVRLYDVADLARPVLLGHPLTGPTGYVYSVAFSPDGRTLAAGVTDGTVWLWHVTDPARPTLVATLTGPAHAVYSVAFAPGGATLAAGSADGTVRLWDTQARAAAAQVCATSGQRLSRAEWQIFLPGRRYDPPCAG